MSLPKPLQKQIDEDAQKAEWRAAEKERAAAQKISAEREKPVKLRKDGTPMKKRGPKPKDKKEESKVPAVKVEIAKKARVPKKTAWQESEKKATAEMALDASLYFLRDYMSDEFIEHCLTLLKRERLQRKRA